MTTQTFISYLTQAKSRTSPLHARNILKVAAGLAVVISLWLTRGPILELLTIVRDREAVVAYLQGYGMLGPLFLSIVIVLQVLVAAIPGHILMIAGGYIYGFTGGALITCISQFLAGQFAFIVARKAGRPIVDRLVKDTSIDKWKKKAARQGISFYMLAFNIPVFPADVMCYVAGLSNISARKFAIANLIGRLPVVITMTLIGSHGLQLSPVLLVAVAAASLPLYLLWSSFGKKISHKLNRSNARVK